MSNTLPRVAQWWPMAVPAILLAALIAACAPDVPTAPVAVVDPPSFPAVLDCSPTLPGPGNRVDSVPEHSYGEGEIFGSIYENGDRFCDGDGVQISLEEVDADVPTYYRDDLVASPNYRLMWEFWDSLGDGMCDTTEASHSSAPYGGPTNEAHCVRPGHYSFTATGEGWSRGFDVDYLGQAAGVVDSMNGADSNLAIVATTSNEIGSTTSFMDLVVNVDIGSSISDGSVVLWLDATSTPNTTRFKNAPSPSRDYSGWFRFNLRGSSPGWTAADSDYMGGRGRALARLYYRNNAYSSWTPFTNYYDYTAGSEYNVIRKHQFPGPTCPSTSRTYQVGAELMNPTETPANQPDSESVRTITVTRSDCPPPPEPPPAPSGVGASSVTSHGATVSWTNGSTASGTTTRVEYQPSGGSWTLAAASLAAGVSSTGLSGLLPSTSYSVRVRHSKGGLDSDWATATNLFTTGSVEAPTGLSASSITSSSATISWTNGLEETGTTTQVDINDGGGWSTAYASLSAGVSSASLSGLSSNTAYSVRVRHSYQSEQSSFLTATDLFTTENVTMPTITSFTAGSCTTHVVSPKTYVDWPVSWTVSGSTAGWTWHINYATSNDTSSSYQLDTGSGLHFSTTLSNLEGLLGDSYVWIRYVNGSTTTGWYPLNPTHLDLGACEA